MKQLRLSPDLTLPLEAVTQTFAILAVRGAGKSNTAAVMAEEMWENGLPFVVVDPVGSWHGLRSSGDGKAPGLAVPIFGGSHGDVPLERTAGQVIADLVVGERLSCVVDVSDFSEGDKIRFLIDFAERLYRKNQDPLHMFLEEADDYAPQRPFREQARLLRAWENIVRRGRARGLGITMISQRSASLNKSVLTQIETLFVLRTTSPQDRKAIGAWVEYHGQAKELLESLPGLEAGEAWVWSPSWLRTMKRVQVRRRWTFDSAATPKDVRGARPPATLADVDLGAVKAQMAATIERAKAEDPRELKRRIAELERQLKAKPAAAPAKEKRVEVPILKDSQVKRLEAAAGRIDRAMVQLGKWAQAFTGTEREVRNVGAEISTALTAARVPRSLPAQPQGAGRAGVFPPMTVRPALVVPPRPRAQPAAEGSLPKAQQRIVDAIAWLEGVGAKRPDKTQVALFADLSPEAGYTKNSFGSLRSAGLIDYPTPGTVALTDEGHARADASTVPQSAEEMQAQVLGKLPKAQRQILEVLIKTYPSALPKDDATTAAGLAPDAGYTKNSYGRLRSLGLIDYPTPGEVVALPVLFLEGAERARA